MGGSTQGLGFNLGFRDDGLGYRELRNRTWNLLELCRDYVGTCGIMGFERAV